MVGIREVKRAMTADPKIGRSRYKRIRSAYRRRARAAWKKIIEVELAKGPLGEKRLGSAAKRRYTRWHVKQETSGIKRDGTHTRKGVIQRILIERETAAANAKGAK